MKFSIFQNAVTNSSCFGINDAQIEMSSSERLKLIKKYKSYKSNALIASVLILFYPDTNGDTSFVLIKRVVYSGVHSGQISFPGGKRDSFDKSNWKTSIRETEEEVGLDAHDMNYVKALSSIYIPPSNFIVYPFIAMNKELFSLKLIKMKLKKFQVMYSFIINSSKIKIDISDKYMNEIDVPMYVFDDVKVWGATATVLSEMKELILTTLKE